MGVPAMSEGLRVSFARGTAAVAAVVVLLALLPGTLRGQGPGGAGDGGAAGGHPFLDEAPENRDWLAPAGQGQVEYVGLALGEAPRLRVKAEALAGKAVELSVTTDAKAVRISRGEASATVELRADPALVQVLRIDAGAAPKLDLNGAQSISAEKDWPNVVKQDGRPWVLEFEGGKRVRLVFAAAEGGRRNDPDFFGISVDPGHPGHRRTPPPAPPENTGNPFAPEPGVAAATGTDPAAATTPTAPVVSAEPLARDFPPADDAALGKRLADATFVVECSTAAAGVTRPALACWVDESGLAVVNAAPLLHARKVEAKLPGGPGGPGAGAEKATVEVVAVRPELDLALVRCSGEAGAVKPGAVLSTPKLAPAGGVALWAQALAADGGEATVRKGTVAGDAGWRGAALLQPMAFEPTQWLAAEMNVGLAESGGPVVNPAGELVGWTTTMRGRPLVGAPELAALLAMKGTPTEEVAAELRELRATGRLGYLAWPRLVFERLEPATTLQREVIKLDRGFKCATCQGKGTVTRQRHVQLPSTPGGIGRDRVETYEDRCPTCEGDRLASGATVARLLEGVAEALAKTDVADAKWANVAPFVVETLRELRGVDAGALRRKLAAVKMPEPMTLKPGDTVVLVGAAAPSVTVEGATVVTANGHAYLLVRPKLGSVTAGGEVLFGGLVAGHVRLAEGRLATVIEGGFVAEGR